MAECTLAAYIVHSILAGIVSPFAAWIVKQIKGHHWSLPDAIDDVLVGVIEGLVVTFLVCMRRAAAE